MPTAGRQPQPWPSRSSGEASVDWNSVNASLLSLTFLSLTLLSLTFRNLIWLNRPLAALLLVCCAQSGALAQAQQDAIHYRHSDRTPPGVVGQWQIRRGGPYPGYYQPIELTGPPGLKVAFATTQGQQQGFEPVRAVPVQAGLQISGIYRLRVTGIPLQEGREVFPTIEVIDRLFPPAGLRWKYPIPIDLTVNDLNLALEGKLVTRVIYLEDPAQALPVADQPGEQRWLDAGPGENPLQLADVFGRPVAILRLGGRSPIAGQPVEPGFFGTGHPLERPPRPAQSHPAPGNRDNG